MEKYISYVEGIMLNTGYIIIKDESISKMTKGSLLYLLNTAYTIGQKDKMKEIHKVLGINKE